MIRTLAGTACAVATLVALAAPVTIAADSEDAKGRQVFEAKQCARCHVTGGREGGVPALEAIRRPQGAWELTGRFWNHAPAMFTAIGAAGGAWPTFTVDEMTDLMTYLAASADADPKPDPGRGLTVLVRKGCLKCHTLRGEGLRGAPDLGERAATAFASPAVWATRIWGHTPVMAAVALERGVLFPRFSGPEMAQLVGYLKSVGASPPGK